MSQNVNICEGAQINGQFTGKTQKLLKLYKMLKYLWQIKQDTIYYMAMKSATTNVLLNNFSDKAGRNINFPKLFWGFGDINDR